jgi:hypothetical protein
MVALGPEVFSTSKLQYVCGRLVESMSPFVADSFFGFADINSFSKFSADVTSLTTSMALAVISFVNCLIYVNCIHDFLHLYQVIGDVAGRNINRK